MRAAICKEFGQPLVIEEVQLRAPQSGELRIKMKAVAICHSDIAFIDGIWGGDLPAIYGHEAAGEVLEVGDGVAGYKIGDPVLVTLIKDPNANHWDSPISNSDGAIVQGMSAGAFAEEVVVDQSQIHPLPADMDMDVASLLACGVITGYGAVTNAAQMHKGAHVVVIGAGGVGLNTIQGAAINGAQTIIAVDITEEKLETAKEFGATHGLLVGDLNFDAVAQIAGGGADYVFVTVGAIPAFNAAPDLLAERGEVVLIGMPPVGAEAHYIPVNLASMSQVIRGSKMGEAVLTRDIPKLLGEYQRGQLKLDELVSHRFAFEAINEAIAKTREGASNRNVLIFES
ncbi:MAG: zinc-binding dehydrogenase [Pseudomonadota bacterium]